ncbi:MAG: hypothetical protein OHK0022_60280 [Roseiflexaceae bacterium]
MVDQALVRDQRRTILAAVVLALVVLGLCYLLVGRATPVRAQDRLDLQITKVLNGSDVVRVGQLLTFTIRITNTGTISVAHLPVIDNFDAGILRLERSTPPYTTLDPSGQIVWTNTPTATVGGPLAPGQSFEITTVFRAIAVKEQTVNRARIGDAIAYGGQSRGGGQDSSDGSGVGGRVIFVKSLEPGQVPEVGKPLTFTVVITNDSAANITSIPLEDVYQTEYLRFVQSFPPPSSVDPVAGRIVWDDVLPLLGRTVLRPDEAIRLTMVFIPLKPFQGDGINRINPGNVQNEFQRAMPAPKRDDVPIRIVAEGGTPATPTPSRVPTARPREPTDVPEATPTPEATPATEATPAPTADTAATPEAAGGVTGEQIATPAPTATTAVVPARLPRTGEGAPGTLWLLPLLALLLAAGYLVKAEGRRQK